MIFYITTYSKNIAYARKVKQMFEKTNFEYYFVYGKDQTQKIEPHIEVDCEEKYENLPLKTYYILEHFLQTDHCQMAKVDDDTYIDFELFDTSLYTKDYTGMFVKYPTDIKSSIYHWYKIHTPEYNIPKRTFDLDYAQGSCYFLNKKAATICYNQGRSFFESTPETYLGEDTKIGMCLNQGDVTKQDLMHNRNLDYETTKELMFIHPIHHVLFDKLLESKTREQKLNILKQYNFLNCNVKREMFLAKKIKELSCKT